MKIYGDTLCAFCPSGRLETVVEFICNLGQMMRIGTIHPSALQTAVWVQFWFVLKHQRGMIGQERRYRVMRRNYANQTD